jgi:pimeloyl-ACP methyl ester carboxylesterase
MNGLGAQASPRQRDRSPSRHRRSRLAIALLCGTLLSLTLAAGSAQAAPLYNITGSWTGSPPNEDVTQITMDPSSGAITGTSVIDGEHFFLGGSEDGAGNATITLNQDAEEYPPDGYTSTWTVQIGDAGHCMVGTWVDTNGVGGTVFALDEPEAPFTETGGVYKCTGDKSKVKGTVLDTNSKPAPGVTINVKGTSDEQATVALSATTDANGSYSIEVPPGNYAVSASGEMSEQNGGKLTVAKAPSTATPECPGTASEATCTLPHIAEGEAQSANFTYTYCASTERTPNGKPPTGCPIVFIPGFLGSRITCNEGELWTNLKDLAKFADMQLQPDGEHDAGAPGSCDGTAAPIPGEEGIVSSAGPKDVYGGALAYLNRIAPDRIYGFTYDWRKSPLVAIEALNREVEKVISKTGSSYVVLMAHSMGGLVTQAYIEDSEHAKKVIRAVTLGTPYWGAPKSHIALLAGLSGGPSFELMGLDTFAAGENLQIAARNYEGLYWLYPSANYGPWLKITGEGWTGRTLGGSEVDPWVKSLGGTTALVNQAEEGHAKLDGFKTNGVDYQVVVGAGVPTITSMEIRDSEAWEDEIVGVEIGSGDGTVPVRSATQGAAEGRAPLGASVPIHYACGVEHVSLPDNTGVQSQIEGFLLKGEPVTGPTETCPFSGTVAEYYEVKVPKHGAAASAARTSTAMVTTASGTVTLERAEEEGLVQVLHTGGHSTIITNGRDPATLQLSGSELAVKVRSVATAGNGASVYYGPLSGTLTISAAGVVERGGKPLKPTRANRPPHTSAHVTRRGRRFIVRLSAKDSAGGVAATYTRIGKSAPRLYTKPLSLTAAQLKRLRFASVNDFGTWERSEKAPRHR